ncbi:MAG: hypothetical protein CVV37_05870 [Nitrospira bacterium HGW-Nitrospira-1]|nr:MAG: hypothetical protein CVV37_05870 [Nitrospira bacterium HGW-Nitrospira-1]
MEIQNSKFKIQNSNDKGIALVMVLVLAVISLSIMAALIYMLTAGTQTSGIQKRYKTALEAGIGGSEVAYQFITLKGDAADQQAFIVGLNAFAGLNAQVVTDINQCTTTLLNVTLPDGRTCASLGNFAGLAAKLNLPTACWSAGCNRLTTINPANNATYDTRFDIGTTTRYRVYAKIVDTVEGNSAGGDEGLTKGGVVTPSLAGITAPSMPYLYAIEINSESRDNVDERAKVSVLYQY